MKDLVKNALKSKWLYVAILAIAGAAGASSETVMKLILTLIGLDS